MEPHMSRHRLGWAASIAVVFLGLASVSAAANPLGGVAGTDPIAARYVDRPADEAEREDSCPEGVGVEVTIDDSTQTVCVGPEGQEPEEPRPEEEPASPEDEDPPEGSAPPADDPPTEDSGQWAPADVATIHPGVQIITGDSQCTSNFVFRAGADVFLGQAAHCADTDSSPTATNGCDTGSLPLGTPVEIEGASRPGTLVYSSWLTMRQVGETDLNACGYNDFALVRLDPADVGAVNPTVPAWGGPTGLADGAEATAFEEQVYSYGNSGLRSGQLSPRTGYIVAKSGDGWSYQVYAATPGIFGDSGSAVLDSDGEALGVLVTVQYAPRAGSNGVTDLAHALDYMHAHSDVTAELVPGTEAFNPDLSRLAS